MTPILGPSIGQPTGVRGLVASISAFFIVPGERPLSRRFPVRAGCSPLMLVPELPVTGTMPAYAARCPEPAKLDPVTGFQAARDVPAPRPGCCGRAGRDYATGVLRAAWVEKAVDNRECRHGYSSATTKSRKAIMVVRVIRRRARSLSASVAGGLAAARRAPRARGACRADWLTWTIGVALLRHRLPAKAVPFSRVRPGRHRFGNCWPPPAPASSNIVWYVPDRGDY
jgi:hypothetical protein